MTLSKSQINSDGYKPLHNSSPPTRERGVLLINLGSPDDPTVPAVRRYLSQFLADPDVIQLPRGWGWLNGPLGRLIARFHAPQSASMYRSIWTDEGSPLLKISRAQAEALQEVLPRGWRVFWAMRYGRPSIPQTLREIEAAGVDDLVIVPMYPQISAPTTGTAMREVYGHLKDNNIDLQVVTRLGWYNDHGYVTAQQALLEEYMKDHGLTPDNSYLLFSAHGLPISYVERGDPYQEHIAQTVTLVGQQLQWPEDRMSLAFQSSFGPVKWLQPYTDEVLVRLAGSGEARIVVCPISFTADCLETLEEIALRYRKLVEDAGAELYLCPALNTFAPFVTALKHLTLRGCRPIQAKGRELVAVTKSVQQVCHGQPDAASLVMIGMSLPGRVGHGRGPALRHTDSEGLRRIKRSACEVPALLRDIQESVDVREALIWNTCHRFEFYGWLTRGDDAEGHADAVARIRRHLFEKSTDSGDQVNVLFNTDARHHLFRTAVGLNSCLPGERDVLEQLHAGYRLAERAGTVGSLARALLEEVTTVEKQLRARTDWGRFDTDYCHIAMLRVAEEEKLDYASCRIVVLGGSTTSATVLRTLVEKFGVDSRQLTLLYRGHKHGGQHKVLRKSIGNGTRVRVQSYREQRVLRRIGEADVIIFGVDHAEPILDLDRLGECRAGNTAPLTIMDFNTFGSTVGLDNAKDVRLYPLHRLDAEVKVRADAICASSAFCRALEAAEERIADMVRARATADPGETDGKPSGAQTCMASRETEIQPSAAVGGAGSQTDTGLAWTGSGRSW